MSTRIQLDALMVQIQEMWGHLDTLFDSINDTDSWDRKHGPDWTFADVPYHLAYCNDEVVAHGISSAPTSSLLRSNIYGQAMTREAQ